MKLTHADTTGRIGLAENGYGTPITVFVCSTCYLIFTVTGDHTDEEWGTGCTLPDCDSYDVERDVDLTFEIEPWRIHKVIE